MSNDWKKLDPQESKRLLETLNPHIEPISFNPENTTIRLQKLPFYKDFKFYEISDLSTVPGARKYALSDGKQVYMINWTNGPIYEVNETAPIKLDQNSVRSYVKFFFTYVRGRHGRFMPIESLDEIRWQNEPPAQGRKVIQEMLAPVTVLNQDSDGTFNLEAYMLFKDSLFRTLIHVAPDGNVAMSDEELKIEGMPVIQDVMMA
jgi:hypothetical protein